MGMPSNTILYSQEEIGNRIKSRRDELDMTLDEVAAKVGVSKSTIQRYENGLIGRVKLPVIKSIANALRVSPYWLVGVVQEKNAVQKDDGLSPLEAQLFVMGSFSQKLKASRIARGLSQEELARRLNTTKQVISHYERGERTPRVDIAAKFAQVLDVPVKYLTSDSYDFRVWETENLVNDYWNASVSNRLFLVNMRGIDPRIASDYERISALAHIEKAEKTAVQKDDGLSPLEAQLMEFIRRLTDDQKKMLLAQIELLLSKQG